MVLVNLLQYRIGIFTHCHDLFIGQTFQGTFRLLQRIFRGLVHFILHLTANCLHFFFHKTFDLFFCCFFIDSAFFSGRQ